MATGNKFKVGDIVKLKSGGPNMTVASLDKTVAGRLFCKWFAGSKEQSGYFGEEIVVAVPDEPKK